MTAPSTRGDPPERKRPSAGGAGAGSWGGNDDQKSSAKPSDPQPPRRDPRDLALMAAPDRLKGALVSILAGLRELRQDDDPVGLWDEVALVLRRRLGPTERGFLLMTAAQAAEPADLDALAMRVAADVMASYQGRAA